MNKERCIIVVPVYKSSPSKAARFSFEFHPDYLYHAIGDKLPFGCHAFEKYGAFYTQHNFISY